MAEHREGLDWSVPRVGRDEVGAEDAGWGPFLAGGPDRRFEAQGKDGGLERGVSDWRKVARAAKRKPGKTSGRTTSIRWKTYWRRIGGYQ